MTDKLKELALAAKKDAPSVQRNTAVREFEEAASPDAILALIKRAEDAEAEIEKYHAICERGSKSIEQLRADLENERRKVTELVDGYEKDQAELKRLRTTIFTDNTQTVVNAEREIERLEARVAELEKANSDLSAAAIVPDGMKLIRWTDEDQEKGAVRYIMETVHEYGIERHTMTDVLKEVALNAKSNNVAVVVSANAILALVKRAEDAERESYNRKQIIDLKHEVVVELQAEVERLKAQLELSGKVSKKLAEHPLASGAAQKEQKNV